VSYQVLARKYRPQRFSDVVGQEHVTQTLANAIAQKRIAHAYLFCGPRGTGKTTIARIFAKCLNCTGGPKVDFADDDPRVQEIAEGRSLDVLEIDGASNNGVEQVRELRDTCRFAPAAGQFKIYIIDEVHMLSAAAFNALLKTLEEPPAHVKFLFATTDPEKVLPTILSRCQRFDLRRIPVTLIVKHLQHIARQEGIHIDEPALHAIARGAEGGLRDAESTLDQLISFCGDTIAESDVLSMFGLTSRAQILALTGAVIAGDAGVALRELDSLAKQGKDLGRLVSELLNHFRNLLVYRVANGDLSLIEVSEHEAAALKEQAPAVSVEGLTRIIEVLADAETRLRDAISKKIVIEVALLNAIEARAAVPIEAVLRQLQQLRSAAGPPPSAPAPPPAAPAPAPAAATPAARPPAAVTPASAAPVPTVAAMASAPSAAPAAGPTGTDLGALWAALLDAVGRASPFVRQYLNEAHPVGISGNIFTIGFDPEFAGTLSLVDNAKNRAVLHTKLGELGHPQLHVKFVVAEAPADAPRPQPAAAATPPAPAVAAPAEAAPAPAAASTPAKPKAGPISMEEFKNDPLIRQALELFQGQIVSVRS
jgi:DNA polymerase-3 subunit gamma/tau